MSNRKKNGKRSATSFGRPDPFDRGGELWDPAEEVEKKLVQAKAVCGAMMLMQDIDHIENEVLSVVEDLIADAEKAFNEFRSGHPAAAHPEAPKGVQS